LKRDVGGVQRIGHGTFTGASRVPKRIWS
jgi:hypothetical protein